MVFAGPGEQATVTDYKGVVAAVVFDVAKLVRRASALSAQIAKRAGKYIMKGLEPSLVLNLG